MYVPILYIIYILYVCVRAPCGGGAFAGRCHTGAGRRSPLEIAGPPSGIVAYYIRSTHCWRRAGFYVLKILLFSLPFSFTRFFASRTWQWLRTIFFSRVNVVGVAAAAAAASLFSPTSRRHPLQTVLCMRSVS